MLRALTFFLLASSVGIAQAEEVSVLQQKLFEAERAALVQTYKGITTDGAVIPGLFKLDHETASGTDISDAASALLDSLDTGQRQAISFDVGDVQWQRWSNMPYTIYYRRGVSLKEMSAVQRERALSLFRVSLSDKGWRQLQDIMRVDIYEEGSFWLTILGSPSANEPWGWQLQGHHLTINYFKVGDQVVMTPTFMGAEPAVADSGKAAGASILQPEQDKGLALLNSFTETQMTSALLQDSMVDMNLLADALQDNLVLDYAGLRATAMTDAQKLGLLDLISEYVGNMRDADARRKMQQVKAHLDDTYFAWAGETGPGGVFYYRIHSPVILIEFAHQVPFALPNVDKSKPNRQHVHSIVRTPNGNDYGKDLLRQYHEMQNRTKG